MIRKHLESKGCFKQELPEVLNKAVACIGSNALHKMKLMMAMTELMVFTSQLRKPIRMTDTTIVPINTITIILAGSGLSKDSSMNMIRKALKPAYSKIEEYRIIFATEKAKRAAVKDGRTEKEWLKYYHDPKDLFAGLGTVEGQLKHMAELEEGEYGAAYNQISEFGSELAHNKNITDIIVALSVAYDLGTIPQKILKSSDNQTASIKSLPYSALFFGSQDNILYDEPIKNKFKIEFTTKLSRRSFFNFTTETPEKVEYTSIEELTTHKKDIRDTTMEAQKALSSDMFDLVDDTTRDPLIMTEEVAG